MATSEEILDLVLPRNGAGAETVRDYLKELLRILWVEEECFDAKRPFGNSGWWHDVIEWVVKSGLVENPEEADVAVQLAIQAL